MAVALSFVIPGKPQPQGSKRVVNGRLIESNDERLRPWRVSAAWHASAALAQPFFEGWDRRAVMTVHVRFHFPRLKVHYRGTRLRDEAPYLKTSAPDLDKLCRALLDALSTAQVWLNDAQVAELHAVKGYDDTPSTQVTVAYPLPSVAG